MAVKEFLSKYKLYTILAVVLAVLIAGGVTLGVLLSRNSTPPADAADVENTVYITANGTQITDGSTKYDYILIVIYDDTVADLICEIWSVERRSGSTATTIVIPEIVTINGTARTITTMIESVFYSISSFITEVSLPNTITNMGGSAFESCSSLTSINIPDSVTSIGQSAFQGCSSLTTVAIGNGVTSIGSDAFNSCSSLTSINIPASVTNIGSGAFFDCLSIKSVYITDLVAWCNINFESEFSNPLAHHRASLYLNSELLTKLVIPNEVISLKD